MTGTGNNEYGYVKCLLWIVGLLTRTWKQKFRPNGSLDLNQILYTCSLDQCGLRLCGYFKIVSVDVGLASKNPPRKVWYFQKFAKNHKKILDKFWQVQDLCKMLLFHRIHGLVDIQGFPLAWGAAKNDVFSKKSFFQSNFFSMLPIWILKPPIDSPWKNLSHGTKIFPKKLP